MKTTESVKLEIKQITDEALKPETPEKQKKTARAQVKKLREQLLFLEQNPTVEFVKNSIEREKKALEIIVGRFDQWSKNTSKAEKGNEPIKTYDKLNDLSIRRKRIKFMQSILKG